MRWIIALVQSISHSITKLFNLSIRSGKLLGIWKCSKVSALFKSGDRTNATNYRAISILPTLSKILERVVHSQLHEYLNSTNLLSNNQLGFRSKRSTATALSSFADEDMLRLPRVTRNWGKQRVCHHSLKDWNKLERATRNAPNIATFKRNVFARFFN